MMLLSSASSLAASLLAAETQGLAIDFTDSAFASVTGFYGSAKIRDTTTPANNYDNSPTTRTSSLLTYTSPSAKMCVGRDGLLRFGAHNLCLQSQTFDTSPWGAATNITVTNGTSDTTAPDGTTTAAKVVGTVTSGAHAMQQNVTIVSGTTYTLSLFVKRSTLDAFFLRFSSVASANNYVTVIADLSTGAITQTATGTTSGTLTASSMTSVGNGWYRMVLTGAISVTDGAITYGFAPATTGNTFTTFGRPSDYADSTSNVCYIWGAQFSRTPSDPTYLATTSTARYALPYEWNTSGVLQGVLVEEARTNLCLRSQDFSTSWTTTDTTLTTGQTSPTGESNATLFTEGSAGNAFVGSASVAIVSNSTSTISGYFKKGNNNIIRFVLSDTATGTHRCTAWFDLNSGTVLSVANGGSATGASASILNLPNGWYRCTVTGAVNNSATAINATWASASANGSTTRVSGATVTAFGIQIEAGSFATSYIPTVAATVTRAADNISLATSAFPWSATVGTLMTYAKYPIADAGAARLTAQIDDGTSSNRIMMYGDFSAGAPAIGRIVNGGSNTALLTGANLASSTSKQAMAWAANDVAMVVNGGAAVTTGSATIPTGMTRIQIGQNTGNYLNGYLKKLLYLPRRMSNSELQTLTT